MLKVNNVCTGYGGRDVVFNVSFSLDKGPMCILGSNGSGKTTLLRAIAALIPYSGSITWDGAEVSRMRRPELAAHIAVMSQLSSVYFPYTVYDTVMLGRYRHMRRNMFGSPSSRDREFVETCLDFTGLDGLRNKNITELSGGQLQRVFLAHTLAQDPDMILLDEPTNHLDIKHQAELIEYLKEWSGRPGRAVIGVFHDINLALRLTDRVLFMKDGHNAAFGRFGEIAGKEFLKSIFDMDIVSFMSGNYERWKNIR